MVTLFELSPIFEQEVDPTVMHRLSAVHPEGRHHHAFRCELDVTDPRVPAIRSVLADAGLEPWIDRFRPRDSAAEYAAQLVRTYDPADLDGLPLLELAPVAFYRGDRREPEGLITLDRRRPWPRPSFAKSGPTRYVVGDRVKRRLERSGLVGLAFLPTVDAGDHVVPWWELRSTVELPPLSDALDLRTSDGLPAARDDSSVNLFPIEGLYQHPELRYRRRDVAALPPFDLGHTREMLGGSPRYHALDRRLIASARFYEFCRSNDLHTEWVPVRIDADRADT